MTANAAAFSVLLLLALSGGFLFAYNCEYTRFPGLRGEGQQLYFVAAVCATLLLIVSTLVLAFFRFILPDVIFDFVDSVWSFVVEPFDVPSLPVFMLAFALGWPAAKFANRVTNKDKIASDVLEDYAGELSKFLYGAMSEREMAFIALNNGKVYVGWVTDVPMPKPRRDDGGEHFRFLPARSGYLHRRTLEPRFTSQYHPIYEEILRDEAASPDVFDFEIVIPLGNVSIVRLYSLDVDQTIFKMPRNKFGFRLNT